MRHSEVGNTKSGIVRDGANEELFDGLILEIVKLRGKLCGNGQIQNLDDAGCDASEVARDILRLRRRREKLFGAQLFGDPAWDILLELYLAERGGRKLSVSGACYASAVPPTTALRWVRQLEKDLLVQRMEDPLDRRRSWLALTDRAREKLRDLLSSAVGPAVAASGETASGRSK